MSLANKIALVTGAARGIGRVIAQTLAGAGAVVIINDRDVAAANTCAAEWQAAPMPADVADSEQVRAMFAAINNRFGRLDILVNNAAISRPRPLEETTDEDWRAVLSVNLDGVFYCCRAAFALMSEGGRIINLSSVSAYTGKVLNDNAAYVASKAGVDGLTRALAREGLARGIAVNSVAPGIVATGIHSSAQRAGLPALVPAGRLTEAEEIAETVLFLASASPHITGQIIHINGGMYFS
ncbi:MAG: SDR family NAD(P)-dependent oxidoreductase [Blastocatellia bacterium]